MRAIILLLGLIVLCPHCATAQTQPAPNTPPNTPNTTVVVPDGDGPVSATTSTTSTPGTQTTVTSVKREDGSATTVITQQPEPDYLPMGQGGYHPMGRTGTTGTTVVRP